MLNGGDALDRCGELIACARRLGADGADAVYVGSHSESVQVRLAALEDVDRSESEHFGLRVFIGMRQATIGSSAVDTGRLEELASRAIAMARAEPPDLLLLDMHLGDMSGLDVSDALMMDANTAMIPRVALSADVMPDQISEARQRGFIEYLTKPLDVSRLLNLLDCCARGEVP